MKKGLFRKGVIAVIIFLFIGVGMQPAFPNNNITINNENQILNLQENKKTIQSDEVRLFCLGRINNLNINETHCSFDCINFRMYFRFYYEGLFYSCKTHYKKNNTYQRLIEGESWEISYTHYEYKDYSSFHIRYNNFRGIIKPSYILGFFSINFNNSSSLFCNELLENDKLKFKNESFNLNLDYVYRAFFMGKITDLEIGEDYYYFNTTDIFRVYFQKFENLYWKRAIERTLDKKCGYYISGTRFIGIIKSDYICGFFLYP